MNIRMLETFRRYRLIRKLRLEHERLEEMEANAADALAAQRRHVHDLQAKVLGQRARHGMTATEIARGVEINAKRGGVLA